ncbi:MAG: class I SAM-dependent methyltransferase [Campylobacteraceae bacterium]|nr:class I SAM-dependent methyltransferase [Campylobacteraceae bacterium]
MNIKDLENLITQNDHQSNRDFKRLFHGRGACYKKWEFLTVDSMDSSLYIVFFNEIDAQLETELIEMFERLSVSLNYSCVILQKRYILKELAQVLFGELPTETYAYELGLKYKLNLLSSRNHGFFADMKNGREFVLKNSKNKRVLNLFSYTCAFSLCAIKGDAKLVVNVDMSKGALTQGRSNHHLNDVSTKDVQFMPYNILKSWNRIKKAGPYDLIIIDPPTFQKGSFIATKDYDKLIKKLNTLCSDSCTVLAASNSPDINSDYIKDIFIEHASDFSFVKRLAIVDTFPSLHEERTLKNLIFERIIE